MPTILHGVKLAYGVASAAAPNGDGRGQPARDAATPERVRDAAAAFLQQTFTDARRVDVTKMVRIDREAGTWEVEARVYTPNATIRNLGLPVRREVLDGHDYLLRLDGDLLVAAYGPLDAIEDQSRR